jgi:catechol 2,3-dioxygenase-like lactoylglutathione lyase family enzyme
VTVPARLSFATIGARDVSALRAFYSALWPETTSAPDGSFVAYLLGGVVLGVYDLERLAADSGGAFEGRGGFELAVNVDERDQVDEVLAEVAALGVHVEAAADAFWGGRVGHFRDPEGNRWEVAWNPAMRFDDRGAVVAFD